MGVEVLLRVPTGQVEKIGVRRGEVDKRSDFELIWSPCFPFPRKRSILVSLCLLDFLWAFWLLRTARGSDKVFHFVENLMDRSCFDPTSLTPSSCSVFERKGFLPLSVLICNVETIKPC